MGNTEAMEATKTINRHGNLTIATSDEHLKDIFHQIRTSKSPAVINFGASWCRVCGEILPSFNKLSNKFPKLSFVYADIDECPETTQHIRYTPTFHFYRDGERVDSMFGAELETVLFTSLSVNEEGHHPNKGHNVFGYATNETSNLMPLTHVLAVHIRANLNELRKNNTCPWVRPDGKTRVTIEYKNDNGAMVPIRVHTVLISSTQNDESVVTNEQIAADLKERVIKLVIPARYLDDKTIFQLNTSGRKINIDTYGRWGAHGGSPFPEEDIVRQAPKSVVSSALARRCLVQVSNGIGVPMSVFVNTYKTETIPKKEIIGFIEERFNLKRGGHENDAKCFVSSVQSVYIFCSVIKT